MSVIAIRDHLERCDRAWTAEITATFRASRGVIYNAARQICGNDTAPDVVQDVFVRVWSSPAKYDPERGTILQYLLVTTRGVALDYVRRQSGRAARDTRVMPSDPIPDDPSRRLIGDETTQAVEAALGRLQDSERSAVVAAFYQGLTYREVATHLDIPEGTAKSRIRSGLKNLRADLID